jgi:hypothetical protein
MTTSAAYTLRQALDDAHPSRIDNAINQLDIGTSMRKIRATIAAATSSATPDITAIPAAKITINEGPAGVRASGILPPIGLVRSLRVTAGTLAAGPAIIIDAGGTATAIGAGTAHGVLLGTDDKTLTFQAAVTGFVIEYFAKPGSYLSGGVWKGIDIDTQLFAGTQDGMGAE